VFGKVLIDKQKGFYTFRDRFQDSNDFVASIYLKKQPLNGSWSFPDVGSFRILGLGEQWASFNYDTWNRENENVVVLTNARTWNQSEPIGFTSKQDGSGIISLKTNVIANKKNNRSISLVNYRSFAVDYGKTSGSPALFVITDNLVGDNSTTNLRSNKWVMNTHGTVNTNPQGFTIQGHNGSTMKGTFIEPIGVQISVKKTKTGTAIQATGGDFFFVVMTVQKNTAPKVTTEGSSINTQVRVGEQTITYRDNKIILAQ
jgi:hypothetical protein